MNFDELAALYAGWIKEAGKNDKALVKKAEVLTESAAAKTDIASALKKIQNDLDGRVFASTEEKLSEENKKDILQRTEVLIFGKPTVTNFSRIIKEASLQDFTLLVGEWDKFIAKL